MKPLRFRYRFFGWLPTREELRILWLDFLNRRSGACNVCPKNGLIGGGYNHWRCQLDRGHAQEHRYRNYTWNDLGRTRYNPLPVGVKFPRDGHQILGTSFGQRRAFVRAAKRSLRGDGS